MMLAQKNAGEDSPVGSGGTVSSVRRRPRLLLCHSEVERAVKECLDHGVLTIDVETAESPLSKESGKPQPRTNDLTWVGLGVPGKTFLIPCGHPKGNLIAPRTKTQVRACDLYDPADERYWTPSGTKPSTRNVVVWQEAQYEPPPAQLKPYQVAEILEPLLFSDRALLGHNLKFDIQTLAKYYDDTIPPGPYHDTIILRHVLDENLMQYGLKDLTLDWLVGKGADKKEERKEFYPNLGRDPSAHGMDEIARYLSKDIRYTQLMWFRHYWKLARYGLLDAYEFEMAVYPVIAQMEYTGFSVDTAKMGVAAKEIRQELDDLEREAWTIAGDQYSLSKTEAKRWILFGEGSTAKGENGKALKTLGLSAVTRTKKTDVAQVTKEVLEKLATRGNRTAEIYLDWSRLDKLRGTFIEGYHNFLVPSHERGNPYSTLHTSYKQHGTVTSRLSSAGPNLQQLPRKGAVRDLFVPRPGSRLVVADYSQIELRCAGYLSRDPEMIRVFQDGEDVHQQAGAVMYNIPFSEVTDEQRSTGKTQNFAVLYGAGVDKIAQVARCSKADAEDLVDGYYKGFARLLPWKAHVIRTVTDRGNRQQPLLEPPYVMIPPYGRMRRLPGLMAFYSQGQLNRAKRQTINSLVQGFASSITKMAMVDLHEWLPDGYRLLAQVHDEVVLEVPEDEADDALPKVIEIMEAIKHPKTGNPILGPVPLVAEGNTGMSWAEAK